MSKVLTSRKKSLDTFQFEEVGGGEENIGIYFTAWAIRRAERTHKSRALLKSNSFKASLKPEHW